MNSKLQRILPALALALLGVAAFLPRLIGKLREQPIAIVCRTDRRSAKAAALLARRSFADVQVVGGGMTAWL